MENDENQLSNNNDEFSNHVKIKKIKRKLKTIFNDLNGDIKVKLEEMQKNSHETRTRLDHLEKMCIPSFKDIEEVILNQCFLLTVEMF